MILARDDVGCDGDGEDGGEAEGDSDDGVSAAIEVSAHKWHILAQFGDTFSPCYLLPLSFTEYVKDEKAWPNRDRDRVNDLVIY